MTTNIMTSPDKQQYCTDMQTSSHQKKPPPLAELQCNWISIQFISWGLDATVNLSVKEVIPKQWTAEHNKNTYLHIMDTKS